MYTIYYGHMHMHNNYTHMRVVYRRRPLSPSPPPLSSANRSTSGIYISTLVNTNTSQCTRQSVQYQFQLYQYACLPWINILEAEMGSYITCNNAWEIKCYNAKANVWSTPILEPLQPRPIACTGRQCAFRVEPAHMRELLYIRWRCLCIVDSIKGGRIYLWRPESS